MGSPLPDWIARTIQDPVTGATLVVHHAPTAPEWTEKAASVWFERVNVHDRPGSSRTTRVVEFSLDDERRFFFKRFQPRGWRDRFKHAFGVTRARNALVRGERLRAYGFPPPTPVCLIETQGSVGSPDSGLITEKVEDSCTLWDWEGSPLSEHLRDVKARWALLQKVAAEVGRFHASGMYHGDLKPGNILFRFGEDGEPRFYWLDNERSSAHTRLALARRVRNLIQFDMASYIVPLTDRRRFWKAYLEAATFEHPRPDDVAKSVARASKMRLAKLGLKPGPGWGELARQIREGIPPPGMG